MVFYSTASLLCLLRWREAREIRDSQSSIRDLHSRWLALAGLSAGFSMSVKPNGLLVFLLLFFLLIFLIDKVARRDTIWMARQAIFFALLALIPLTPWLVKNLAWTGNPLFPFFGGFFGGSAGGEGEPGLGILERRRFFYGESWWQIAALPLRIFFSGQDDKAQYFDGVLNPMLILFLPWAFKGKWAEEKKVFLGFVLVYFLYASFLTELRIRYLLPVIPPLVILLVYGLHNIYLRIAHPSLLFGAALILLGMNGLYLWSYFHRVSPVDYLSGRESREAYLARVLPDYPPLQFINQSLPSTAKVYFLFMGRRVYYCEREYIHDGSEYAWTLIRAVRAAGDEQDIYAGLRRRGLTHMLVRDALLLEFLNENLTLEQKKLWVSFANRYLRGLFHSRGYSVYQIHE
jgi:energy-coupling factor transporter transmembrane protein EcfT